MHPLLNIASKAARRAGDILLRSMEKLDSLTIYEKQHNDFVSEVDRRAEEEIVKIIRQAHPDHGIIAEESGVHSGNEYNWIIDPLDGTTNYIHGFPHFCVSIALEYKGQVEHGVIYNPVSQEFFTASKGSGAQLNDRRIRVSSCSRVERALLTTGMPFRHHDLMPMFFQTLQTVAPQVTDIRRTGSAALDLAYVAAGRIDGYWEFALQSWDLAAGALIVKEAGGFASDPLGKDEFLQTGNILAGTPKIYDALRKILEPILKAN